MKARHIKAHARMKRKAVTWWKWITEQIENNTESFCRRKVRYLSIQKVVARRLFYD